MKIQVAILIMLIINSSVFGQHCLGLKADGGLSRISTVFNSSQTTQMFQFVPSGHGGFFYSLQFGRKSVIGAEALFIQIEGKERMEIEEIDLNGNPTGELIIDNIYRHISYLGFPLYFGLKFKKLTITFGFQASFALASSGREKGQMQHNGEIIAWDNTFDDLNIDSYDFGPRAGLIFNLTDRFAVEGTYYYGINNILDDNFPFDWTWRVQQMTVGLRYTLLMTGTKNEKIK